MVRRLRIASHTVDHCCNVEPKAAHAAEAKPMVMTTNMMAADTMRFAAAAAAAAAA